MGWSVLVGAVVFGEEFAALAGAVGVAGEGEDFGVVDEAVDHGGAYLDFDFRILPLTWYFVSWTGVFD
ncbi:hypothetical protein H4W30_006713 [Amycolatopsis roodepoortensis]|uniref:Uncharacterized protein n=1 Tax=Amycolatopsis roodepoortensis TaxID=700274 RepID=A0ABR9LG38_9PSEU|nr:hypothetical protein [Amycolatopsis roodepoortensis]